MLGGDGGGYFMLVVLVGGDWVQNLSALLLRNRSALLLCSRSDYLNLNFLDCTVYSLW